MYREKTVLGIIPARGGSKGLPRKNILPLCGKPLVAWTIEAARASGLLDRVVLSSEDPEIADVARAWGCDVPFTRPLELAADDTPGIAPVLHALQTLPERYDYVVLLQPTSPLRQAQDIDGCIIQCVEAGAPACVSVTPASKHPALYYTFGPGGQLRPLSGIQPPSRRQDTAPCHLLNGAVYVARTEWLLSTGSFLTDRTVGYSMPEERSFDIDTRLDMIVCEALLRLSADPPQAGC